MAQRLAEWRAFFVDDQDRVAVISSAQTDWESLPPDGFLGLLLLFDDRTSKVFAGHEFVWRVGVETWEQGDEYPEEVPAERVRKGTLIEDGRWEQVRHWIHKQARKHHGS